MRREPAQCELFTYAGNDPVSFVDPTGLEQTSCDGSESLDELLVSQATSGGIDIYGAGSAAGANLTIAGAALQATGDDIALVAGPGGAEAVRGVGAALDLAGGAVSVPLLVADQMALEDGLDRVVSADSGAERLGAAYDTAGSLLSVSGDMASIGVGLETLGRFGVPALRGFTAGPAAPYIAGASAAYTVGTGVGRELLVPALDSEAQRYGYETHAQAGGDFIQAAVDGEFTLGEFVEFVIFDYYNPFSD